MTCNQDLEPLPSNHASKDSEVVIVISRLAACVILKNHFCSRKLIYKKVNNSVNER